MRNFENIRGKKNALGAVLALAALTGCSAESPVAGQGFDREAMVENLDNSGILDGMSPQEAFFAGVGASAACQEVQVELSDGSVPLIFLSEANKSLAQDMNDRVESFLPASGVEKQQLATTAFLTAEHVETDLSVCTPRTD